MKLAVAAAILAETLPLVSTSSFSTSSTSLGGLGRGLKKKQNSHHPAAGASPKPGDVLAGPAVRRLKEAAGEEAQRARAAATLRNLASASSSGGHQECDPSAPADVGVLSCGTGRYCLESAATTGTGVCVDDAAGDVAAMHRTLQGGVNGTDWAPLLDLVGLLCDGVTYPDITCQCSVIDSVAYTATANCAVAELCAEFPDACGKNFTFCGSDTLDLEVTGPFEYSLKTCTILTAPEAFSYCATNFVSAIATTCEMSISDIVCNVCTVEAEGRGFDCLNTYLNYTGYARSNYTIPDVVIAFQVLSQYYYAIVDGPCASGCNLCGEGGILTIPEVNVSLPNGDSFSCGYVQFAAFVGDFANSTAEFGVDLCQALPALVMDTCGCEEGVMPPTTAPSPTTAPEPGSTEPPAVGSGPPVVSPTGDMGGGMATPSPTKGAAGPSGAVSKPGGLAAAAAAVVLATAGTLLWAV